MSWDKLTFRQKAEYIKAGVKNGITDINGIKNAYNSFGDGGDAENQYQTYKKQDIKVVGGLPFIQGNLSDRKGTVTTTPENALSKYKKAKTFRQNALDDWEWRAEREHPGMGAKVRTLYENTPTNVYPTFSGDNTAGNYRDENNSISLYEQRTSDGGNGFPTGSPFSEFQINRNAFHELGHAQDDVILNTLQPMKYPNRSYQYSASWSPYYVNGKDVGELTPEELEASNIQQSSTPDGRKLYSLPRETYDTSNRLADLEEAYGTGLLGNGMKRPAEEEFSTTNRDIRNAIIDKYGVTKEALDAQIDNMTAEQFYELVKDPKYTSGYLQYFNFGRAKPEDLDYPHDAPWKEQEEWAKKKAEEKKAYDALSEEEKAKLQQQLEEGRLSNLKKVLKLYSQNTPQDNMPPNLFIEETPNYAAYGGHIYEGTSEKNQQMDIPYSTKAVLAAAEANPDGGIFIGDKSIAHKDREYNYILPEFVFTKVKSNGHLRDKTDNPIVPNWDSLNDPKLNAESIIKEKDAEGKKWLQEWYKGRQNQLEDNMALALLDEKLKGNANRFIKDSKYRNVESQQYLSDQLGGMYHTPGTPYIDKKQKKNNAATTFFSDSTKTEPLVIHYKASTPITLPTTFVHENAHALANKASEYTIKRLLELDGYYNYKERTDLPEDLRKSWDYLLDPTEVQSRMMEVRKALNLSPKDKLDKEFINRNRKTFNDYFFNYFDTDDLVKLFNLVAQNETKPSNIQNVNYAAYGGEILKDGGPRKTLDNLPRDTYEHWRASLPKNLQDDTMYNLKGAYENGDVPTLEDDGLYHLHTRDPKTGEILKKPMHPTFLKGLLEDARMGYYPYTKDGKIYTDTWKGNKWANGGNLYKDGGYSSVVEEFIDSGWLHSIENSINKGVSKGRYTKYRDQNGNWTIGDGLLLDSLASLDKGAYTNLKRQGYLTETQIKRAHYNAVKHKEREAKRLYTKYAGKNAPSYDKLNRQSQLILLDAVYNGLSLKLGKPLYAALASGDKNRILQAYENAKLIGVKGSAETVAKNSIRYKGIQRWANNAGLVDSPSSPREVASPPIIEQPDNTKVVIPPIYTPTAKTNLSYYNEPIPQTIESYDPFKSIPKEYDYLDIAGLTGDFMFPTSVPENTTDFNLNLETPDYNAYINNLFRPRDSSII